MHDTACDSIERTGRYASPSAYRLKWERMQSNPQPIAAGRKASWILAVSFRDVLVVNVTFQGTREYPGQIIVFVNDVEQMQVKEKRMLFAACNVHAQLRKAAIAPEKTRPGRNARRPACTPGHITYAQMCADTCICCCQSDAV